MKLHPTKTTPALAVLFCVLLGAPPSRAADAPARAAKYNVVWNSPSQDAAGSMPLGNGELGINLWAEANGDLLFYLSRNDSLSEISQLCKVGLVRLSFAPNPFAAGVPFRQELRLQEGVCEITAGPAGNQTTLRVFVDSQHPVVHVTGESAVPLHVTARVESWRTEKQKVAAETAWTLAGAPFELWQAPDVFPSGLSGAVAWYHRNETSVAFDSTIQVQSLESIRQTLKNPLLHRTFGGWIEGTGFEPADARTLTNSQAANRFSLRLASPCAQTPSAEAWLDLAHQLAANAPDAAAARRRAASHWESFWERSWIDCDVGPGISPPASAHPLRLGVDGDGGNQFPGVIGGTKVVGEAWSESAIAAEAARAAQTNSSGPLTTPRLGGGLTLAAWIRPEAAKPGRIFDQITPGGSDGFLFDTHPGDTLRFIVGTHTLSAPPGTLKLGVWQHAAATVDFKAGTTSIYLNGRLVASGSPALNPAGTSSHGLFLASTQVSEGAASMTVGKAYALQRYMQACAGRGIYPIKFNGSIFTVEPKAMGKNENPDWRRWGDCHWWQNVRMPYHAMLGAGDFDLMHPLFETFESIRPFAEARARLYHQAEGCYFAETMTVWGTYANRDYGWDRTGKKPNVVDCMYWRYAWNQGLELVGLLLDHWEYTRDEQFLKSRVLPMAESVLKYFDTRFRKDADGRIVVDPTQSVETYWYDVVNDTPAVAGLNDATRRLAAIPDRLLTESQRAFFAHMKTAAPVVPIEEVERSGKKLRRVAVAQKYNPKRSNVENPELFPVWPFRLFGLGKPMLEEARNAYAHRGSRNDIGWGYDSNVAALLGLTDEAARILRVKIVNSRPGYRWPATWGPNFDWLPDQCHGGNLMATTQYMLLQSDGDALRLLPAWPKDWDVHFKLHAPKNTTVECLFRGGKVERLVVTPADRAKDVIKDQR